MTKAKQLLLQERIVQHGTNQFRASVMVMSYLARRYSTYALHAGRVRAALHNELRRIGS